MPAQFNIRSNQEELMDDLNCSGCVVDQTLRELDTINRWLGGNHVTINGINQLTRSKQLKNLKIVDVGCGSGDMLIRIAKWARKKKIEAQLVGIDANPNIVDFAAQNSAAYPEITYQTTDILSAEFKNYSFDILTATLFTHHFNNDQLTFLFKQFFNQSKVGFVINDIHRHWFAYHSIKLLTRIFSKSEMVRFDAPLSVLRSFSKAELESLLVKSGINNYRLVWMWAFRWQVVVHTV